MTQAFDAACDRLRLAEDDPSKVKLADDVQPFEYLRLLAPKPVAELVALVGEGATTEGGAKKEDEIRF